ncbi:FAD-dependent pyridine nucleotide-disulfide oxidoreductase [uncultured Desulfobacterium sp.]|uniref:FAD-dependent pyridine nucleotide-disulfide oxidoreductase n=1 Tax=uncultured Desulfobacterium sp. TaxID=201089 RepID=A0A445MUX9_9BACT|nr:FAD-dependent pyridine nucleotide-disulfide oxidoreductase [uncultured Desulfobacterium sp.]
MPKNIVIVGAVALGPKAACRFKRLEPNSTVIMVDQGDVISYGGCGIPYFISGDVSEPDQLQRTSFHMLRDEKFFRDVKDVEVMTNTRALSIDRKIKTVLVMNLKSGKEQMLSYDKLVLATGSRPNRLNIAGADLEGVFTVSNINEAVAIKKDISGGKVTKAVVIGAGAIGLEMAEALADMWDIETSVIDIADQVLPGIISSNMARMVQHHLKEKEVTFFAGERVLRIEGETRVTTVVTDKRSIDADMVIMAVGVSPNSDLARNAGLKVSQNGAIIVNKRLQTSDPDIYSGGDCVQIPNLVTGKPAYYPLGSMANKQGRVIGTNLAGGSAEFEGAVGSFVLKIFDISVASSGRCIEAAKKDGFDALSAFVVQFDRAHFYPEKDLIYLELVVDKATGRVLGIQGIGNTGDGMLARVNAVAAILKYRPTISDISNLELPYSPPFSSAMDVINALGNTAENILAGMNRPLQAEQFNDWWNNRKEGDTFFLDCRGWGNAGPFVEKYPDHWKNIPQDELRKRIKEVPRDKKIALVCNTGVRSYEAQLILNQEGFKETYNVQGGMAGLKKFGADL